MMFCKIIFMTSFRCTVWCSAKLFSWHLIDTVWVQLNYFHAILQILYDVQLNYNIFFPSYTRRTWSSAKMCIWIQLWSAESFFGTWRQRWVSKSVYDGLKNRVHGISQNMIFHKTICMETYKIDCMSKSF